MTGLVFLFIAFVLSASGSLLLWLRHRDPTSFDHGITEFQLEMRALSPERDTDRNART